MRNYEKKLKINHDEMVLSKRLKFSPEKLRRMRKKIFLTTIMAADLIDVSVFTWRSWEYSKRNMPNVAWNCWIIQYQKVRKKLKKDFPFTFDLKPR